MPNLRPALSALALCLVHAPASAQGTDVLVPGWFSNSVHRYDPSGAWTGPFVGPGSGGLINAHSIAVGPDGNLYITSTGTNSILRYDGATGAPLGVFVPTGLAGLSNPFDADFGPDGHLYVTSGSRVMRFDGATGASLGDFVPSGSGGLSAAEMLVWGPDGHLYVASANNNSVKRYDGQTGAFIDTFVTPGSGGLDDPHGLAFGPDGNLYVASFGTNPVLKYDRVTGASLGALVSAGPLAPSAPHGLMFGTDGLLYVASFGNDQIRRYDGTTGAFVDIFVTSGSGGINAPADVLVRPEPELKQQAPLPGIAGGTSSITVYKANPGELVVYVFGTINGPLPLLFCPGLQAYIQDPVLLASATADGFGVTNVSVPIPSSAAGLTVLLQSLALSSCRVSNLVRYTF
ncbi:MAG: NHL repeat-containing protein [Planctomycetota bacterium]